ncbi:hypothetical protein [Neobacillus niacini]|uniref:hypothetical protein n=1 Tax=Neobacillus niacini TaxID=86668 RepID=UPI001C8EAA10|nr:hypothetical protein [Neobacillus niacini]MBY0144278.1 hypothetical protein [Neobacillus niacini]
MKTAFLISFMVQGIEQKLPFQIVSKNEPNKVQILEKITEIVNHYDLSPEIKFDKFHQEKSEKLYLYKIGDNNCAVRVERKEIFEFTK